MPLTHYLLPQNRGWQIWQMMASNTTPGGQPYMSQGAHPYNFSGLCAALVVQWLLEIKAGGKAPDELARHLLQGDLGQFGYFGIAKSQDIYKQNETRQQLVQRHSGGMLTASADAPAISAAVHWSLIQNRIYGTALNGAFRLGQDQPRPYNGYMSIRGNGNRFLSYIIDTSWGHAIGIHSTAQTLFIFDPNYGVFVTNATDRKTVSEIVHAIWADYNVAAGDLADIT